LNQVKEILITPTPERLGECGPVLEDAAELLKSLLENRKGAANAPHLTDEVHGLRRELGVVAALMQQAAGYYLGWAQMLGAATTGYTSEGAIPPLATRPQLSVEG
jgi:hypothetical protein